MLDTSRPRDQHRRILVLAGQLAPMLRLDFLSDNAADARLALSELSGALDVHLRIEDELVYPELLAHGSEEVSKLAKQFVEEMGAFCIEFRAHIKKWASTVNVLEDADGFVAETSRILDKLVDRIRREDDELYPLVDKLALQ